MNKKKLFPLALVPLATTSLQAQSNIQTGRTDKRPNIILFMVDDMGYSDIGCYGGEILTPNIDALASKGVRFTQFYNTSRSCPARASLMTGLYQHQAGIGQIAFFVIPFLQSTVIEHLQIVLNDERNDIVFQALLKHN